MVRRNNATMNQEVLCGVIVFLAAAFGEPSGGCQGPVFTVNGVNYTRESLKTDIKYPLSLSYDRSTNSLFMTHHIDVNIYTVIPAKMDLNTNEFKVINEGKSLGAVSVDAKTNNVYIQTSEGIYKYDKNIDKSELYVAVNRSIATLAIMLFVKDDVVYFSAYPDRTLHKIVNGEVFKIEELHMSIVRSLVIDDDDNMFFTNSTGLYRQKVGSEEAIYYEDSKGLGYNGITINNAGEVYAFARFSGIYAVSKNTNEMVRVLDVTADGLTFDGDDNMIYADYSNLYRLKPITNSNCV